MPQYDSESIFLWVPACNLFWSFVLTFYSQLPIKQAILLTFNSFLRKRYQQVLFRWLQQPHPLGVSPWRKWEDITRQDLKDIDVGQWFNEAVISWRALCRNESLMGKCWSTWSWYHMWNLLKIATPEGYDKNDKSALQSIPSQYIYRWEPSVCDLVLKQRRSCSPHLQSTSLHLS